MPLLMVSDGKWPAKTTLHVSWRRMTQSRVLNFSHLFYVSFISITIVNLVHIHVHDSYFTVVVFV